MKGLDDIIGKIEALVIDLRDISRESEAHQSPPEVRSGKKSGPYVLIHQDEIAVRDVEIQRLKETIGDLSDDLHESRAEALLARLRALEVTEPVAEPEGLEVLRRRSWQAKGGRAVYLHEVRGMLAEKDAEIERLKQERDAWRDAQVITDGERLEARARIAELHRAEEDRAEQAERDNARRHHER